MTATTPLQAKFDALHTETMRPFTGAELDAQQADVERAEFDADAARAAWRKRNELADLESLDDRFRRYGR